MVVLKTHMCGCVYVIMCIQCSGTITRNTALYDLMSQPALRCARLHYATLQSELGINMKCKGGGVTPHKNSEQRIMN